MTVQAEDLSVTSSQERLLLFVTSPSAGDRPKVTRIATPNEERRAWDRWRFMLQVVRQRLDDCRREGQDVLPSRLRAFQRDRASFVPSLSSNAFGPVVTAFASAISGSSHDSRAKNSSTTAAPSSSLSSNAPFARPR